MNISDDKKTGDPLLFGLEQKLIKWGVPKLPGFVNGYNLTWCNVLWTVGVVFTGLLASINISWLWLISFFIFAQWLTDTFDGAVGRYRKSGLVKWGYYMDHLFDYLFLAAILFSYSLVMPVGNDFFILLTLIIFSGFMINTFLYYGATGKLQIAYLRIGPTEIRLVFIIINTLIIFFGKTYMAFALPYVFIFSALGLWFVIFKTQKEMYQLDMEKKEGLGKDDQAGS